MAQVVYAVVAIGSILGTFVWLVRSGSLDEIGRERSWRRITRAERRRVAHARREWSR
jgi:hypothetical protein